MGFHENLANALTTIVGRQAIVRPKGEIEDNRVEIRFPNTLYWLNVFDDGAIVLEHRCIAYTLAPTALIQIDPTEDVLEIIREIDHGLFDNIRPMILKGHTDYVNIPESSAWQKAFRRRMLFDIWGQLDTFSELLTPMFACHLNSDGPSIHVPSYNEHSSFVIGDMSTEMDDEAVAFCLGFLSSYLDKLEEDTVLVDYGIVNWREFFLGPNERSDDEVNQNQTQQLINVLPMSVLTRNGMLPR